MFHNYFQEFSRILCLRLRSVFLPQTLSCLYRHPKIGVSRLIVSVHYPSPVIHLFITVVDCNDLTSSIRLRTPTSAVCVAHHPVADYVITGLTDNSIIITGVS